MTHSFQALKRKKRYDRQLQQIDGTLTTIEQQREALEGANTNTAVLQTMSEAAKALKKAHADMDVDQVCCKSTRSDPGYPDGETFAAVPFIK
jgi:charged multivesicular body protein 4